MTKFLKRTPLLLSILAILGYNVYLLITDPVLYFISMGILLILVWFSWAFVSYLEEGF